MQLAPAPRGVPLQPGMEPAMTGLPRKRKTRHRSSEPRLRINRAPFHSQVSAGAHLQPDKGTGSLAQQLSAFRVSGYSQLLAAKPQKRSLDAANCRHDEPNTECCGFAKLSQVPLRHLV